MKNEKYQLLKTIAQSRESTRTFSEKQVADEEIEKIIDIAQTSPYASGKKNWEIIVIKEKEQIKAVSEVVKSWIEAYSKEVREDFRESFLNYSKNFSSFENAPVILIPVFRNSRSISLMTASDDPEIIEWERDAWVKSISCVSMLILLAAESLDLGACYMTGPLIAENKIKEIIPIKPGRSIGAIITIGHKKHNKPTSEE